MIMILRLKYQLFKLLYIKVIDVKRIIILAQIFRYNVFFSFFNSQNLWQYMPNFCHTYSLIQQILQLLFQNFFGLKANTVCSTLSVTSNLLEMDTSVHFIVIYLNRKLFSRFEIFLWFWNFENRLIIEDFMDV